MFETLIRGLKVRGPAATFNLYDIVESILVVGDKGRIGRGRLGEELMLGPGAVRTLISRLKKKGYMAVGRDGCRLTHRGLALYSELKAKLVFRMPLKCWDRSLGRECFLACVRDIRQDSINVVSLRDTSVKAGANGALILKYRSDMLFFAGEDIPYKDICEAPIWHEIKSRFDFKDSDVLIVAFAEEKRAARDGALAAALSLLG